MLKHDLTRQLQTADRAWQRQLGLAFFLRASKYVAAVLLLLFVLDVAMHLDARWRAGLAAAYLALGAGMVARALYLARVRRNSLEKTARLLESRDAALGSKLINFLQLRDGLDAQPPLTRQLGEMALADYSARLAPLNFEPLTRLPELPRIRRNSLVAVGTGVIVLAGFFPISKLELLRFADPFGDHPPYSLTRIEIAEPAKDGARVTYNQGVVVHAKIAGHRPDELYLSFYDPAKPQAVHTVPMFGKGEMGFLQELDGVKTDLLVYAHTKGGGSVSKKRLVNVALSPLLDRAFVTVAPPAYTTLKPDETAFQFKDVRALAGSEIKFRVRSNRPLASGSITLEAENAPPAPTAMVPSGENEVSGTITAAESGRLKFVLVDVDHNVSQQNLSANLSVTHDLPPEVRIETPAEDAFVCEDFKVEARIVATDDYGLQTVRIHRALNEHYSAPKTATYDPGTTAATERIDFDIKDLGVQPGDMISFFAEAVDTCPEPHLARSQTVHLLVISTEAYNDAVRERSDISDIEEKYSGLLNDFQDLVDEQKAINDKIKELQDKLAHGAAPRDAQEQMDKLTARQAELNAKLADMATRMEKFVRAKPAYDLEKDLQETLTQKAAEIRASLAQSNESLKNASQAAAAAREPNQEKRLQALSELQKQGDKQLAQLDQTHHDAEDKIIPPLEDAEKMNAIINDLNQFKQLYEAQTAAAEQLKPLENASVVRDTEALALKQLAGTEKQIEQQLGQVTANLRQHAKEARALFPKAAESARDFAVGMEQGDLRNLASRAATTMLAGRGGESYVSAENLRQVMAKFFQDAEQRGQGTMCPEMDTYLRLHRNLTAGDTFKQMSQGRKPGSGQSGTGSGQPGQGGLDGYAAGVGQNLGILGGETRSGQSPHAGNGSHGQARAAGPGQRAEFDKADVLQGVPNANRATGSVPTENTVEGYRDAIDAYFNTITK